MTDTESRQYKNQFDALYKECEDLYRSSARLLGLSECAMWILCILSEQETSCTQSNLCEIMSQPRQTINSVIRMFEKQEKITLVPAPGSKKEKLIQLTPNGQKYVEEMILPFVRAEQEVLRRMGKRDCAEFLRLMKKYNDLYESEFEKISAAMKHTR